ncbi:oxygen-independent coproporphyrinogen III oxidase [Sediminibacterium ginsengisoli]|uniref:Coproporphyrinogen-III oxidase n=1 Tax=Sediminibacterium ginsengisoli TaxID=413434 RepID=A0A1T4REY4_9BACT|nr:oxygen-independent coproporphyrinogen III oxidase [Sediminibacterium ginsengisoli]SKA14545.1 oxygen-independent coproporphyrinogen-3 oxidase [Sediminibacterium ginsengisoli]
MNSAVPEALLQRYNIPVPRYTSYPTVPHWQDGLDVNRWQSLVNERLTESGSREGISLYIHLPFCESLCTYCGCNKKISVSHHVEDRYILAVLKEWQLYRSQMPEKPILRELHLGGGTPTFFSPENLELLLIPILDDVIIHEEHTFSFEGHPNNTTKEHLQKLYNLGFRRVSYGVQDLDPEVQRVINRIQPFENVKRAVEDAREIGYTSVNFDLIYGLPLQTHASMQQTLEQSLTLAPDRIAFYSYAHVPWTSKAQRLFDENDLPPASLKMELYQAAKACFVQHGYTDIGMDHFALPDEALYEAWEQGRLHRNFMGYTEQQTGMLLGLGVSAISDTGNAYAQNEKNLQDYYRQLEADRLPVTKGYFLDEEDKSFKQYILDISCRGKTVLREADKASMEEFTLPELAELQRNGLINWEDDNVKLTETGRHFIRNVCRAFDLHLLRALSSNAAPAFSKAV